MTVIHPFHPLCGRSFVFGGIRRSWAECRVFVLDHDGSQLSFPLEWTDAGDPDVFVAIAAGRSPFRVQDLLELSALIERFKAERGM